MSGVVAAGVSVLGLLTAVVVLVTAVRNGRRTEGVRAAVAEVHLLVNSRLDEALAEIKSLRARGVVLTEALEDSDVAVPPGE